MGNDQTETSLLNQYAAGECVDLLDDYDFPARTITDFFIFFLSSLLSLFFFFLVNSVWSMALISIHPGFLQSCLVNV